MWEIALLAPHRIDAPGRCILNTLLWVILVVLITVVRSDYFVGRLNNRWCFDAQMLHNKIKQCCLSAELCFEFQQLPQEICELC